MLKYSRTNFVSGFKSPARLGKYTLSEVLLFKCAYAIAEHIESVSGFL